MGRLFIFIFLFLGHFLINNSYGKYHPNNLTFHFKNKRSLIATSSCNDHFAQDYSQLPLIYKNELAFLAKDLKNGDFCELNFFGLGGKNAIKIPFKEIFLEMDKHDSKHISYFHTHPLKNNKYFIQGSPYDFQIMFANKAKIQKYSLSLEQYNQLNGDIINKKIPSFNFAPPSLLDLQFLLNNLSARLKEEKSGVSLMPKVIAPSGIWSYTIDKKVSTEEIQEHLYILIDMALFYVDSEIIKQREGKDTLNDPYKGAFQLLTERQQRFLKSWAETAFGLRRPYSQAALLEYERGNSSFIIKEYYDKIYLAAKFSQTLKSIGIIVTFVPFFRVLPENLKTK